MGQSPREDKCILHHFGKLYVSVFILLVSECIDLNLYVSVEI